MIPLVLTVQLLAAPAASTPGGAAHLVPPLTLAAAPARPDLAPRPRAAPEAPSPGAGAYLASGGLVLTTDLLTGVVVGFGILVAAAASQDGMGGNGLVLTFAAVGGFIALLGPPTAAVMGAQLGGSWPARPRFADQAYFWALGAHALALGAGILVGLVSPGLGFLTYLALDVTLVPFVTVRALAQSAPEAEPQERAAPAPPSPRERSVPQLHPKAVPMEI